MAPATHAPPSIADLTAIGLDSHVKPLGYVCWFSVPDASVSIRKLRKTWQLAGLDPAPLPKDQKAVNVFKRAVRDQAGSNTHNALVTETDVRLVLENAEDVIYQISQVVRDQANRVVDYPKALRVWFSKVTEDIDFKALGEVPRAEVLPIMEAIQSTFEANLATVSGGKVRTLVRRYLTDDNDEGANLVGLSGENMRGKAGGVYFVLAKHKAALDSLAEMLDELYTPHGRAYLYLVPLADGASEREMIRRQHAANCLAEMDQAIGEAASLLRQGRERSIRTNVASHHWNRLARLKRHAAEYATALKGEEEELNARLEMLNRQLKKLV